MRERTTWDRQVIKKAFESKKAEDPRAMNQDHLQQQPSADKYTIGDPSDFAEDVAPSNWKAEYEGGTTRRNEIGLPEFRKEAADQEDEEVEEEEDSEEDEAIEKKANLCLDVARRILPKTASQRTIEDQALAFMFMPDRALVATATRLAQQQQEEEEQQSKQAQQQQQADESDKDQGKQAQQQQQADEDKDQGKQAQQQQADESDKDQGKQAQQQQEEDDKENPFQDKQAKLLAACDAIAQSVGLLSQQVQQLSQQQGQQQAPQFQAPVQSQQQSDDLLIDQMLQQDQQGQGYVASLDVEMDSNGGMDLHTASDDEALKVLFANHQEVREASQAQSLQTGIPGNRTASTRTVGTRPSAGVSQLGGGSNVKVASDVDQLSSLWRSDPDVKGVFG